MNIKETMEVKEMNTEEAIEFLENFLKNNPYPEDIFTPILKEDYIKINDLLKKEMGYPIDRLFGNMGRKVYQTIGEDLKPIISLLQQGEADNKELKIVKEELKKYRQMWVKLRTDNYYHYREMQYFLDELEQEYFPKEVSQNYEESEE